MLNWLTRRWARRATEKFVATRPQRSVLYLETLEAREVPAITIQLDYSYDTSGFFNNPAARAVMQQAATDIGNTLTANLAAITPSGSNTWSATFFDPSTGAQVSVPNLSVAANTITVFVGARSLSANGEAGVGGFGGYSISGSQSWISNVENRNWGGFAPSTGSIAFDTSRNWYFGTSTSGLTSSQLDFYSVAEHELGHVLGIGTSTQWNNLLSGSSFVGAHAETVYGGPVPVSTAHWANGVTINGQQAVMDPVLNYGQRVYWTTLDAAALEDLGWNASTPTLASPPASPPPPPSNNINLTNIQSVAFTGGTDGTVYMYSVVNGVLSNTGQQITPFAGYHGVIRIAAGDFTGDGVQDYALTIGSGPQAVVEIISGRDGSVLVPQTVIFPGFRGGLFVAVGDIDGTGKDELAVSADAGAGPHIETFRVIDGQLVLVASFFAFDNPNYLGGARVAIGDLNGDGFADLIVTTGGDAEGRVAMYDGKSLSQGIAKRLYPDFNPFPGVWAPINAAVGDMTGDGFGDLAVTIDGSGPAHVKVWSGAMMAADGGPGGIAPVISFYAFSPTDPYGARLVMRPLEGYGLADLVVVSADPNNPAARVFNYGQALAAGGNAPTIDPLLTKAVDGIYAGLHTSPPPSSDSNSSNSNNSNSNSNDPTSNSNSTDPLTPSSTSTTGNTTFTASSNPTLHQCNCAACRALAQLANAAVM